MRDHEDNYYCTDGLHLVDGLMVEATIECPKHSSIFDCKTAEVETPPACENLHTYAVKVDGGRVLIEI